MVASITVTGYRSAAPAEVVSVNQPRLTKYDGTAKTIIGTHGHGNNWTGWQQDRLGWSNTPSAGGQEVALVDAGYVLASIDAGGPNSWGCAASQDAMTAAYNWLAANRIAAGPKVGIVCYSMGGLVALNWLRSNPDKVAGVFCFTPAVDLQYFWSQGGSYQTEIDTALGGAAISTYSPAANPAAYTNLDVPVAIYVGDADTTVPPTQTADFVAAVNNPRWTRQVVAGYDHLSIFDGVPVDTTSGFFRAAMGGIG